MCFIRFSLYSRTLSASLSRMGRHYSLEQYIPLFIDYQTVYLSADNNLRYREDIYKYDPSLLEAMNNLNLKP